MVDTNRTVRPILGSSALLLAACGSAPAPATADAATRDSIKATMAAYMVSARKVDAAGMASFFAPTGVLFEPGIQPLRTPDTIRAFLSSFPGVRVDSATAVTDTLELYGASAYLWGSYFERLAFPGQPVSEQHGKFVVHWIRDPSGRWVIQRYYRIPLPGTRLIQP